MLAAKRFPEILRSVLSDGVEGAMILTIEGSVLSSDFLPNSSGTRMVTETAFAAIVSSIWHNYLSQQGTPEISCYVGKLERGSIAVASAGKSYVVAAYGSDVSLGLLRGRVDALSQYFNRIFDQMK